MDRAARRRAARSGQTTKPYAILWSSNAAWAPTGYGTQTKQVVRRLAADGHAVAVAANYGLEATSTNWEGIEHFPKGYDGYSNDVIGAYYKDWSRQHPDFTPAVVTLYDTWVFLNHPGWDTIDKVISWVPIDHDPVPPKVLQWCQRESVTPVAMSKFGSAALTRAGVEHVCIPHGIDVDIYKPTPVIVAGDNKPLTGRQIMRVPEDAHVTGIINANKGVTPVRKSFDTALLAWSIFAKDKPDAWLYIHSERHGGMGGIPFEPLIQATGAPQERIAWVNQYQLRIGIPDEAMAALYTGLDTLLAPTLGEGFGLTVAEAAACETRPIVQDWTAQPELVADGWKVGGQPLWDPAQDSWFSVPSVPQIVKALEESYETKGQRSPAGRQHIVDNYNADTLYVEGWRPLLESL